MRQFNRDQAILNTMNQFTPQATQGIDWTGALNSYTGARDKALDEEKRQALAAALQGGDQNQINGALAAYDPKSAASYMLQNKRLEADAANNDMDRQLKQAQIANLLNPTSKPTDKIQNYEYFSKVFGPDRAALMVSPGSEAIGGALVNSSGFGGLGAAGMKEYDKALGKNMAEKEALKGEAEQNLTELKDVYSQMFGNNGLISKAQISNPFDRRVSDELIKDEAAKARAAIRYTMGGLRLNESQAMKGALSDSEQAFLNDMVSGDLTRHTPPAIEGALKSIMNKLEHKAGISENNQNSDPLGIL